MIEILSRKIKILSIKSFMGAIKFIYGERESRFKIQSPRFNIPDVSATSLSY